MSALRNVIKTSRRNQSSPFTPYINVVFDTPNVMVNGLINIIGEVESDFMSSK